MSKYNVLSLNRLTSGSKRGLLDMNICLGYLAKKKILLLDRTIEVAEREVEDKGICTESGDYTYNKTDYISNYKSNNSKNPLATEEDKTHLVVNELQFQINSASLSDDMSTYDLSDNPPKAIQLTPKSWLETQTDLSTIEAFNQKYANLHVIYEFEKIAATNLKTTFYSDVQSTILPLNDLVDVCVKSRFKKNLLNPNIPKNLEYLNEESKNSNIDIYTDFSDYPYEICQCNNDSYVITRETIYKPYYLKSDLKENLLAGATPPNFKYQLERDTLDTYLYKPLTEYKLSGYSSFRDYLSSDANHRTKRAMMEVFSPRYDLKNIQYNYIINLDQNGNSNPRYDNPTNYENGDIFGHFMLGKNAYNSTYSMEMHSQDTISCCRMYCGIQNSQNQVLVKYYDRVDYKTVASKEENKVIVSTMERSLKYDGKLPYQKVEYVLPTALTKKNRHKSNLFSIKLYDTGLDDEAYSKASEERRKLIDKMKLDISNGLRTLAEHIAPANTQLFKTYFLENS